MKKKGFTLIELLAVIVILAVIAIIAVPTILNVVDKAKKGAATASALNYIDAVEKYMVLSEMDSEKYPVKLESNTTYQVSSTEYVEAAFLDSFVESVKAEEISNVYLNDIVSIKGKKPTTGIVTIGEKNTVASATLVTTGYEVECTNNDTCNVKGKNDVVAPTEYKETILNGTYPVIRGDLVPVTIEDDGTVKKADINSKWYSYQNKKWANAIIPIDKTKNYNNGDIIPEAEIESYFVWIPRYRYKIFNDGNYDSLINGTPTGSNAQEIEIVFENKDTNISTGLNKDEWLTHPVFTTFNSNGMWVGKFETTGSTSAVTVKPNLTSLRNQTIKTFFELGYNYNRTLDSHMMKNTEWGAVAYLSHSKYGIDKEVNINNNSSYITGYSAVEGTDQSSYPGTSGTDASKTLAYNTITGYKASTTGNITGIYDMSGGTFEYMASYMSGQLGSSGITPSNYDSKYFDVYSASSAVTSYKFRILGDATGEMGPFYQYTDKDGVSRYRNNWYDDVSYFIESSNPWFDRGGGYNDGVLAGAFNLVRYTGGSYDGLSFRLVLTD